MKSGLSTWMLEKSQIFEPQRRLLHRISKHNIDDTNEYHKRDEKNGQSQMTLSYKKPTFPNLVNTFYCLPKASFKGIKVSDLSSRGIECSRSFLSQP
jgi:hypothetical protein